MAAVLFVGAACAWRFAAAAHVIRAWPAERPVPPLELVDLAGKPWRLDALAGKVVVLNFWATWGAPCRIEMPSLAARGARLCAPAADGAGNWNVEVRGERISQPAVGPDGTIYLATGGTLRAFDADGAVKWEFAGRRAIDVSSFAFGFWIAW